MLRRMFDDKIGIDGVSPVQDGWRYARRCSIFLVKAVTGKPIFYAGMGEKLSDLEQFYPDRMANRILGMGDVLTLIEKAQESMDIDEEKAKADSAAKMKKGRIRFRGLTWSSMKQMQVKWEVFRSILSMMPGYGDQRRRSGRSHRK